MPSRGLATTWQSPCSPHLQTAQLNSAWTGPSSRVQVMSAACRCPGGHSTAGSNTSGGGRRYKQGLGACTSRLHSRPLFASGSHGVVRSAARQPSSSSNGRSSSRPAQPCPLHACLLRYGITDVAAFSAPKHLALSQEVVNSDVEPKLADLAAEGLSPKQVVQLLSSHKSASLLLRSYKDNFHPNLQLLRQIAAFVDHRPHPKCPDLTAAGKILATSPTSTARYLSRDPSKVQQLLQWLEGSLGIVLKQLAGCKDLCHALTLSAGAASAVCVSLQEQHVPAEQVAFILLKHPSTFGRRPNVLSAQLAVLQQHLGLHTAAALEVATAHPLLLSLDLKARLPPLVCFLDSYMGEEGAGRKLVRAQPTLGLLTVKRAERSIGSLAARGYSQQWIQELISKQPTLLQLKLDSPLQRQKLRWIDARAPWPIEAFFEDPRSFTANTRRMAGRVALLGDNGLAPGATPSTLARQSDTSFMAAVRQRLARQGRELPWASWPEWEDVWLGSEEGREWGFPPPEGLGP